VTRLAQTQGNEEERASRPLKCIGMLVKPLMIHTSWVLSTVKGAERVPTTSFFS
jgi:hypothetical protein